MTTPTRKCSYTAYARRCGVDLAVYTAQRRRGRRWCSWCRDFHPADQFSGRASMCRKGFQEYQAERKETPRSDLAGPWTVYVADPHERCDRMHATMFTEAAARALVHDCNAAAMRGWRPGQPQPALYYAVAASAEEVTNG